MKIGYICILLILVSITVVNVDGKAEWSPSPMVDKYISTIKDKDKDDVIIGFKDYDQGVVDIIHKKNGNIKRVLNNINTIIARVPSKEIEKLKSDPNIRYLEFDQEIYATSQYVPWGITRINTTLVHPVYKGTGVKIAVIDTGIDYNHPDLDNNYIGGYDYIHDDSDPMDDNGHGTHVAGIIAAEDNDMGVLGVAPEAKIYAAKVLGAGGSGTVSDLVTAIYDSVNNDVQIISMSLGTNYPEQSLYDAVNYAYNNNVILIAAAGNHYSWWDNYFQFPAAYDSVIAVTATDETDSITSFSNYGRQAELAAPGQNIYSTYVGGSYATMSGTSMSTPHVSGVAALVISSNPSMTNAEVRERMQIYARDMGTYGRDIYYGYGIVDAYGSVFAPDISPKIMSNTPTGNNIPINAYINITFSESMDQQSAQSAFSTSPSTTGTFSWNGNTMIYTPSSNLTYSTVHTVTIGTEARDLTGNNLQSSYSWQFTTQAQPNSPPNLPTSLSQYKSDGTTGINFGGVTNENIVIMKGVISDPDNDNVQLDIEIKPIGTSFTNIPTCSSSFMASGSIASTTCMGLTEGQYHWQARTKDYRGATGNWISAGGNSESNSDFIVDLTNPTGSITINNGATYTTSISVILYLTYNDIGSGIGQVRYSNDGILGTEPWETPSSTKSWTLTSGDGTKTVYYQVRDNSGRLSSIYSDNIILDAIYPTVTNNLPTGINVDIGSQITVNFSEPMNQQSVQSSLSTSPSTTGTFSWNGNTMIYAPTSSLAYSTTYTVTIGTGAKDLAGNNLQSPYSWQFNTDVEPCGGNTPPGQNIETDPASNINLTYNTVSNCGNTIVNTYSENQWAQLHNNYEGISFYDIQTTATYSNGILINIIYSNIPSDIDENSLKMFHYENGNWRDITTFLDTNSNKITGNVNSLSPFSIAGEPTTTPTPTPTVTTTVTPIPTITSIPDSNVVRGSSLDIFNFIILSIFLVIISILRIRKI